MNLRTVYKLVVFSSLSPPLSLSLSFLDTPIEARTREEQGSLLGIRSGEARGYFSRNVSTLPGGCSKTAPSGDALGLLTRLVEHEAT
jgi:hypothetical protein